MKKYYKTNYFNKDKISLKYRLLIIISITLVIYGIITVNINLSEVARNESSFSVITNSNPPKVTVDIGKNHIVFNTQVFNDFKNGTIIIVKTIKSTIVSLVN